MFDVEVIDYMKGFIFMDMFVDSIFIFILELDDSMEEGFSDNDDFIIDGRVLCVLLSF